MTRRCFAGSLVAAVAAFAALSAQAPGTRPATAPAAAGTPAECSALKGLTFDNGTTVTDATMVTTGTLSVSQTATVNNMPPFCRVQAISKPSSDSNIFFEVWLPERGRWNGKFLSTGEGGFAGSPNYGRNGNDGALDEIVRRGYATASTDTGHKNSESWWAVGHPERAADYLYRAKHVTTVAAKSVIAAFYGRAASRSYFSSCSNGGRQGLIEAQR